MPDKTETSPLDQQIAVASHYDKVWHAESSPTTKIGESWESWPFFKLAPGARLYALGLLGNLRGKKVLDLACGVGYSSLELAQAGAQVIALDLSAQGLQTTQARAQAANVVNQVKPVRSSVEVLPFADNSFDLIFAQNFLMHVSTAAVGQECYRVLKPGGRAIFIEPLAHHPLVRLYRAFFSAYKGTAPHWTSLDDLAKLAAPFPQANRQPFYFLTAITSLQFIQARGWLLRPAFSLTTWFDRQLLKLLPSIGRIYWVSVLELTK